MAVEVICFFGAHFFVPVSDSGLALQLIGYDVISILLVLFKDVRHEGEDDKLGGQQFGTKVALMQGAYYQEAMGMKSLKI